MAHCTICGQSYELHHTCPRLRASTLEAQLDAAKKREAEQDELLYAYEATRTPIDKKYVLLLEKLAAAEKREADLQEEITDLKHIISCNPRPSCRHPLDMD